MHRAVATGIRHVMSLGTVIAMVVVVVGCIYVASRIADHLQSVFASVSS
jgi:hypothetical protein